MRGKDYGLSENDHIFSDFNNTDRSALRQDLDEIVQEKIKINERKYPVEKAKGRKDKYDKL